MAQNSTSAAAILAIPETEPERLFQSPDFIIRDYKDLLRQWHPDLNQNDPEAGKVTAHITTLFRMVREHIRLGKYNPPGAIIVADRAGKRFQIKYLARRPFELGEMLISRGLVTFVIPKKHEDMVIHGLRQIGSIRYPNEEFRRVLTDCFPRVVRSVETVDSWVICVHKEPHEVLLSDLIAHLGGQIEPKHVAWIMSSLLNLASFLEVSSLTLNAISPSTVFVSPEKHAVSLYGGWWYAQKGGGLITSLPPETFPLASRRLREHKVASGELDIECIRAIGRACLGDPSGGSLRGRSDVPAPFAQYLLMPSGKSAIKEYQNWPTVLESSFGPRRFHKLDVSGNDVYPQGEVHG